MSSKGSSSQVRKSAIRKGFRSGLEEKVSNQLSSLGVEFSYEDKANTIAYTSPAEKHTYKPDFKLPNGVIVETKGIFDLPDRKKHLLIKEQHPGLDIRFVFDRSKTPIYKGSPTTYADWCRKNGFQFADKLIPQEWINENPSGDLKAHQ